MSIRTTPTTANASPAISSGSTSSGSIPAITSPIEWAVAQLRYMGLPVTVSNVAFLTGWQRIEGGNWSNTASYNPLNTTLRAPGSKAIPNNLAGVQSYTSWNQGIQATAATLQSYPAIMAGLSAGDGATADLSGSFSGDLSRWSGGGYSVVPPASVSGPQVAQLDASFGQIAKGIIGGLIAGGASGLSLGNQAAGGASGVVNGLDEVGSFFSSLGKGITWIRILEVVGGLVLLGVGVYLYAKVAFGLGGGGGNTPSMPRRAAHVAEGVGEVAAL